jgi:NDP-sugar pyrophosphorylase family protein
MKAVILAGGKGSRLEPYTHVFPKPLMPIGSRPILEIILRQLAAAGIDEAVLTVGHQAARLMKMVTAAGEFDLTIRYSEEAKPMGTAGPLKLIRGLGRDFLVLNGDILTDLDFKKFIDFHLKKKAIATIASFQRDLHIDFGLIETEEERVVDYYEKPEIESLVSMGIYAFKRDILNYIPEGKPFDFPDLVHTLLDNDLHPVVYRHRGEWLDIGRPDDYRKAVEVFFSKSQRFLGVKRKSFTRRGR